MTAQIQLPQLSPESDHLDDPADFEAGNFVAEQGADDPVQDLHSDAPTEGEASVPEQAAQELSVSKPRKFGRLLIRPFARGGSPADIQTAKTTRVEREQSQEDVDEARYKEIMASPLLQEIPESERAEAMSQTFELYKTAKEMVAPVIVGFADYLLDEAQERQIIFAGRDGLGAYKAAEKLKQKFDYENSDPDQLVYAYLTRRVVHGTDNQILGKYLQQLGIHNPNEGVVLADIGMYGSIVPALREVLPKVDVQYVISRSSSIPGYADGKNSHMTSVESIMGNPAIHFLEDTFSGVTPSPNRLIEIDGQLVPNTLDDTFPPAETLKREFALKAIEDYASGLEDRPEQPPVKAVKKLDAFLADPKLYARLMVPHQR